MSVMSDSMLLESQTATATSLYTKIFQASTISPSFTNAINLLATTPDRFQFLQLFLQQLHLLLSIKSIVMVDIPKYSNFNDL